MMNSSNFRATVRREKLDAALKIVKGTVPARARQGAAERGVLIETIDGNLWLSSSDAKGSTRTQIATTVTGADQALIDYGDLVKAVRDTPVGAWISLHRIMWARRHDPRMFRRHHARTRHAVAVDGEQFCTELKRMLRVASTVRPTRRFFGVRLWFADNGVILEGDGDSQIALAHVPGRVDAAAVGRAALLPRELLTATLPALTGPVIDLGVSLFDRIPHVSITSGATSLVAIDWVIRPFGGVRSLFTTPAYSVTLNRIATQTALTAAAQRAGRVFAQPRPVVVHVDTNPIRITYSGEPDDDRGRILAFDARVLRQGLNAVGGHEVTLHVEQANAPSRVIVTASDTTLGDVSSGHHHILVQYPNLPNNKEGHHHVTTR